MHCFFLIALPTVGYSTRAPDTIEPSFMGFKDLQIRYQTARSLPAPYAYFYTLHARPTATNVLQLDLAITYPDRDDIDDDELMAEGYTREDDFSWAGQLSKAWLDALTSLVKKPKLKLLDEEHLREDDDYWDIRIETDGNNPVQGSPIATDEWQYTLQELIQATYEQSGRERPFELTYLNLSKQQNQEIRLTASFAERSVQLTRLENRQESRQALPWSTLQQVIKQVYSYDYSSEEAQQKRPNQDGHWLNLGSDDWHKISHLRGLVKRFDELIR